MTKTIAVDLDGTIIEYDGWKGEDHFGKPIKGAKSALKTLKDKGYIIIIWTTRGDKDKVAKYLKEHDIPFDYINENPYQPPNTSCKIYADYYIDDRAVEFRGSWSEVLNKILQKG